MTETTNALKGSVGVALLRITLGVILLVAWFDNLDKGLYTADGFEGFMNYLFDENGNDSSLGFYQSIIDAIVIPLAGPYGAFQAVVELILALALIFGVGTRLASLVAVLFFGNLFLAYFGGNEWIWTYVLLLMSALTVFLGYGGRKFGVDEYLVRSKGESPRNMVW
ncbi:MAG: DoxX family membrane protein [Actinobacteria bacterium]|nr:DoxX family membrane protein [Actinomycetota bacterium]